MKTIGLIGGIGPESTIDYYRLIVERYRKLDDGRMPALVITSVDVRAMLALVEAQDLAALTDCLVTELERLARAGAAFAAMTANTPHIAFDQILKRSPIPLVSIVEAVRDFSQTQGYKKLGLLGTRFTMNARFYHDVFESGRMSLVVPAPQEIEFIHERYVAEFLSGKFTSETRARVAEIVERLRRDEGVDAVILAGTELPLLLRTCADIRVPLLNTTEIHVARIVARALA